MSIARLAARLALALTLGTTLAACDGDGVTGPPRVESITVTATPAALAVGQTAALTATVRDADGNPLTDRVITWSTSNNQTATVSSTGVLTAHAAGQVRVTASSGQRSGAIDLVIAPRASLVASITLDPTALVLEIGQTRQLTAIPRDAQGAPVTGVEVGWSAAGAQPAATVSATGLVTAQAEGTMTITAIANGKLASLEVVVLGASTHDLVFDRWDMLGTTLVPQLHRLDLRTPGATPTLLNPLPTSAEAAPSPDGSRVAYSCSPAICMLDVASGNVVVLPGFSTTTGPLADQPAWSPDGTQIAYRAWNPGGTPGFVNPTDVWVMNVDGSNKRRLTTSQAGVGYAESPTWSPNGARIAFSHGSRAQNGDARANIESVRVDGTDRQAVTAAAAVADEEPTWSPDGSTIAFVRTGGTADGDIWLVNAAGGNERALMSSAVEPSGAQRSPAWSPDGGRIAFVSSHEILGTFFAWQVYTVRADGTDLVRRTSDRQDTANPAWLKR